MAASGAYARYAEQDEPGLYLVHPQDERVASTCDIFVIHGLHGGATKTWRHPDSGNIWFRDLLPDLIRTEGQGGSARIWTYGYPASVAFQTSTIYDFAQALLNRVKDVRRDGNDRKIVWICHSLGGLVLKQALIEAKINPRFVSISANTAGIVFLGTPHRGSDVANLGTVVATIVSSALPGIRIFNREVLRDLKSNNHTLFGISSQFSNICSTMTIHSFHETMPMGTQIIVDQTSAIMHLENERKRHGLYANHREMCRFRDGLDQNWFAVGSSIVELVALSAPGRARENPNVRRPATTQSARRVPYDMSSTNPYAQRQAQANYPIPVAGTYPTSPQRSNPQITRVPVPQPPPRPPYTPLDDQRSTTPTHAPPQLPPGWVAQWDVKTTRYFFVERATGISEWEPPQPTQSQAGPSRQQEQTPNDRLNVPGGSGHQRSASAGSAPSRMPYPSLNKAHSRENFQTRSQPTATASTPAYPAYQPQSPSQAQPPARPAPQTAATAAPTGQPPRVQLDPDDESHTRSSANCDACLREIRCSEPRVQCTVCYDYDLCIGCFHAGKETKNHKRTHKLSHILSTTLLQTDDLTPAKETINPEFSSTIDSLTRKNWSIEEVNPDPGVDAETKCFRYNHLYDHADHARFLTSARPGHYAVSVVLLMKVAGNLDAAGRAHLSKEGAGFLRVSLGTVKSKKEFFSSALGKEDVFDSNALTKDSMPHKLLNHYWWDVITIDVDQPYLHLQSDAILNVDGDGGGSLTDLGLVLQWSGCPAFAGENAKDAVVSVAVEHVRMDNLLDYLEPHIRAPVPAAPKPVPSPAPVPAEPEQAQEEEISEEELKTILLNVLREANTIQERNALQARLAEQFRQEEQAKRELVGKLWIQALAEVVEEQERAERQQRFAAQLLLQQAAVREQERREAEAAAAQQQLEQAVQGVLVEAYLEQYLKGLGLR